MMELFLLESEAELGYKSSMINGILAFEFCKYSSKIRKHQSTTYFIKTYDCRDIGLTTNFLTVFLIGKSINYYVNY